jgi:hypothetical protein
MFSKSMNKAISSGTIFSSHKGETAQAKGTGIYDCSGTGIASGNGEAR